MDWFATLHTVMPLLAFLIGQVAPHFVEWLKVNPAVKFLTPETIKTVKATIVFIGVVVAALDAYFGGGAVDVPAVLRAFGDIIMVYAVAFQTYHESVKK